MITVEKLKQFGANTSEGLERCLNNEAFYLKLVVTKQESLSVMREERLFINQF